MGKFYHNVIDGAKFPTEPFYVAIITPVIHYCMGGLETTTKGECVRNGAALPGLYVAGEAAGGVHGNNRLGGNSLLIAWSSAASLADTVQRTCSARQGSSRCTRLTRRTRRRRTSSSLSEGTALVMPLRSQQ